MPRRARFRIAGYPQLVRQRGHNDKAIFVARDDYKTYLAILRDCAREEDSACDVHAYALLPDSATLLCTPKQPDSVWRLMQSIGRRYVQYFNSAHGRSGTLWNSRYHAALIEPGGPTIGCYRHVDTLPVAAGMARSATEYAWSSARAHVGHDQERLIVHHEYFVSIGGGLLGSQRRYAALLEQPASQPNAREIESVLSGGLAYGGEAFKDRLERQLGRSVRPGRPGRPPRRAPAAETSQCQRAA
ncbi:MAG: transposase [Chromatiales bacterium]|nr:transposase [Chromatiales bacterium]